MTGTELLHGLPARIAPDCRVLVLGSMPGTASLQAQRYYAHPRNRFWPLMAQLAGFDPGLPYEARLDALQRSGIGLWDVIARCRRRGSLDSAIVAASAEPNPLAACAAGLPSLAAIACNGGLAARAFERFVQPHWPGPLPPVHALPSTSAANAAFDMARLRQAWQVLAPWITVAGAYRAPAY
ncbi:DNA-deoxyinosine glycosylase [Xanthomonas massiliensis]|uniref:DNA-deoxyinosine glycosylase n=1 Tax=Xanthomonas massiliensis TaxID=1720302 RepID=UPI000826F92B|nr:DNA-deoxyinosine glycosylase [Xanthomonas massiliensis]